MQTKLDTEIEMTELIYDINDLLDIKKTYTIGELFHPIN